MDQSKEIPLLESLLNFQKDVCNICDMPSKCYHVTLQNCKQCKGAAGVLQITGSVLQLGDILLQNIYSLKFLVRMYIFILGDNRQNRDFDKKMTQFR